MGIWPMIVVVVGVIGSVASIVGLVIAVPTTRQRVFHVIYSVVVVISVAAAVWSYEKLSRIEQVERAASELAESRNSEYTSAGFIQGALAFLEKNKDLYPDSYARALEMCRLNACLGSEYGDSGLQSLDHGLNQIQVASALEGLLRGIATINKGS